MEIFDKLNFRIRWTAIFENVGGIENHHDIFYDGKRTNVGKHFTQILDH